MPTLETLTIECKKLKAELAAADRLSEEKSHMLVECIKEWDALKVENTVLKAQIADAECDAVERERIAYEDGHYYASLGHECRSVERYPMPKEQP